MQFSWQGERARRSLLLDTGPVVTVIADSIRQERGSCHARIFIKVDEHTLAWTSLKVEDDSERVRLTNSAWKRLATPDQKAFPNADLKHFLDGFCEHLWDAYTERFEAEMLTPLEDMTPTEFALRPYIVLGGGTILFAPPGRGKSYTALLMAVSVDAGCSRIWQVDVPRPTLFLNLERAKLSLKRRLALVNLALGLEAHRPLLFINARGKGLREVEEAARRSVAKHGVEVVFMDSISRAGLGSLVEDRPANAIIDTLSRICPTWVALAHTPRQDETHAYGSQMMDAGEDVGVQLITQTSNNGTLGIGLKVVKANDIAIPSLQVLVYTFDEYGLSGARIAKHGEFPEIEAKRRMTVQEQVREYLLQVGEVSATAVSQQLGISRQTISKVMSADTWLTRRRHGHEVLYSVSECQLSEGG
jgi:hypothetical protein